MSEGVRRSPLPAGQLPGEGEYGSALERATQFILSCQKANGLVSFHAPEGAPIGREIEDTLGVTGAYNHAISSLTLSEIYGMSQPDRSKHVREDVS